MKYWHTKEFYQSPKIEHNKSLFIWGIAYRKGSYPQPSVLWEQEPNPAAKRLLKLLFAFIVHETTPKVGQYLKGDWLKDFIQQ